MSTAIEVPSNSSCAFCDYLAGRRPFTIAARNRQVAVLVTREQRGLPHLLVVPTVHRETLLDLTDEETAALSLGVRAAAQAINDAYRRPGIAVWQNNGVPAHQTIAHAHFHVAGTLPEGGTDWGVIPEARIGETDAIAKAIGPYLSLD
ncbi:HIT family protein [Rhodococcus sp. SBT000017]|uniref:HIT family protein n=1 Tax=unclassified Rhodococcus (in: high G+C Gram-positive bacteria) TaxID=192944 RepID=UPI000EF8F423|nr:MULTISPECIES: HIT family protein [unclassified Rhodococcus (in: high G+C Gram-positive bacteria)]RMB75304.1 HIT family protein [Rhodococcus sp. SBT000017]